MFIPLPSPRADPLLAENAGIGLAGTIVMADGPKSLLIGAKVVLAKKLRVDKSLEIEDICKTLRISRSTFYRYVRL